MELENPAYSTAVKYLLPYNLRWQFQNSWIRKVSYYDHPEGENLFSKLVATNKLVIFPGLFLGWCDVNLKSHVFGYQLVCGRLGYWTYPFVGAATFFTVTTYAATRLRKKDDGWNYILGAFAAGGAIGMWQNCTYTGWSWGIAFAAVAVVKRVQMAEGWEFFPTIIQEPGELRSHKHDYTTKWFKGSIPKGYDIVEKS